MRKRLAYIDQNVVGLLAKGEISLPRLPELCWVYSKEHFAEIRRCTNPKPFLSALEGIDAKLLDTELDSNWKITGKAQLTEHGSVEQHYASYLEAIQECDSNANLFDPFLAWINGGSDEGPFKELPDRLAESTLMLLKDQPMTLDFVDALSVVTDELSVMIGQLVEQGNDITKTRKALGAGKGLLGSITGDNQLLKIWEIIRPACPGTTCDQFFGFDPVDKQGYDEWPLYLGIVGCCAVMDIIGFQAEKKCRKLDKIPNVWSDSNHIAMGAFCSAIVSQDKRLIGRARAIYDYKSIATVPLLVK
jgi:hypothetical protein